MKFMLCLCTGVISAIFAFPATSTTLSDLGLSGVEYDLDGEKTVLGDPNITLAMEVIDLLTDLIRIEPKPGNDLPAFKVSVAETVTQLTFTVAGSGFSDKNSGENAGAITFTGKYWNTLINFDFSKDALFSDKLAGTGTGTHKLGPHPDDGLATMSFAFLFSDEFDPITPADPDLRSGVLTLLESAGTGGTKVDADGQAMHPNGHGDNWASSRIFGHARRGLFATGTIDDWQITLEATHIPVPGAVVLFVPVVLAGAGIGLRRRRSAVRS